MREVTYSLFTRRKENYRGNKRKCNIRDCPCIVFSSSTEVSSLTVPNIILYKDLIKIMPVDKISIKI